MSSTITVVIPQHNQAALLAETINSVLIQTRLPDEIIVVDDGSTDNTKDVVESYGPQVRYHYQTNAREAAARNTGQRLSTGDFLIFLDHDDLWLPEALEKLEKSLISDPNAVLAYCLAQIIDGTGQIVSSLHKSISYTGDVWKPLVQENFLLSTGSALIRRSALDKTEPWDVTIRGAADWDMFLRLAEIGPFVCVPEPLFQYRFYGSNMSSDSAVMRRGTARKAAKLLMRHWAHPARFCFLAANYSAKSLERARRALRANSPG